jgi:hypothetical protein
MGLFLDGRFLVQLLLASLGERFPGRRHIQKHLTILRRASVARERTAFLNMAEIFRDLFMPAASDQQRGGRQHDPRDERRRAGKYQNVIQDFGHRSPPRTRPRLCACHSLAGHQIKIEIPPAGRPTLKVPFGSRREPRPPLF